jgi:hypothetical protein
MQINLPPSRVVLLRLTSDRGFIGTVQVDGVEVRLAQEEEEEDWATPSLRMTMGVRLAGLPAAHKIVLPPGSSGTLVGPRKLELRYALIDGPWPAAARPLPPRPSDVMPFDLSDSAVTTGRIEASW